MKLIGSSIAAGVIAASVVLTAPSAAHASVQGTPLQAAAHTSASACLQGFDGPTATVNSYSGITLKCVDNTKGVLHIDADHPIKENGTDDVHVNQCMDNILAYGSDISASTGNTGKRTTLRNGRTATIIWRTSQKDVVTMYTNGSVSNDWALCAAG